jgi:hypothetical protein
MVLPPRLTTSTPLAPKRLRTSPFTVLDPPVRTMPLLYEPARSPRTSISGLPA